MSVFSRSHPAEQFEAEVPLSSPSSQSSYHSTIPSPQYHKVGSSTIIFSVSQITSLVEHVTILFCGVVFSS